MAGPGSQMLWHDEERTRFYLLEDAVLAAGPHEIVAIDGRRARVSESVLVHGAVPRDVANAWAAEELGATLREVRGRNDRKLDAMRDRTRAARHAPVAADTRITPDAVPALWAVVKRLPSVIAGSLSGDSVRIAEANGTMADLQWRLHDAGIDVDERFGLFPDRLAALREDLLRKPGA